MADFPNAYVVLDRVPLDRPACVLFGYVRAIWLEACAILGTRSSNGANFICSEMQLWML